MARRQYLPLTRNGTQDRTRTCPSIDKDAFCVLREYALGIHRDSERQLHFDSKFEHEEMVLVA